ncbi:MAG: hypothetical protein JWM05_344, partial [Acidimicrobiales bacterium]|nr:hypothetical protein [Acidimicrobiales bacterium]
LGGVASVEIGSSGSRYSVQALDGHPTTGPGLSVPAVERAVPQSDPATWQLARLGRLVAAGSAAEPTFAPEPIGTDPPVVVTATEHTDGITAVVASGTAQGQRAWSFATGGRVYGAPRYDPVHGRLFFGAADRKVYGLDARGLFLWSYPTGDSVAARPVVAGDLVIVAGEDGKVHGLDAATGRSRWTFAGDAAMVADPVVERGVVVVGTDNGTVYGLDAQHGTQRWSADVGGPVQSPIASASGAALVAGSDGLLKRFDARSGTEAWSADLGAPTDVGAVVDGPIAAVVDADGQLVARNVSDGSKRWLVGDRDYVGVPAVTSKGLLVSRSTGRLDLVSPAGGILATWDAASTRDATDGEPSFHHGPRLFRGEAYVVDRDSVLRRLAPLDAASPASLALRWIRRPDSDPGFLGANLAFTPVSWRGRMVLLDSAGHLYTGDARTGATQLVGKVPHKGAPVVAPVVVGDDLLVFFTGTKQGAPGTLARVSLRSGAVRWSTDVVGSVQLPLVVRGSRAVVQRQVGTRSVVEAYDLRTGRSAWQHPSANLKALGVEFGPPGPVADDRTVYAGVPLAAYDLQTGTPRWTATAPGAEGGMALAPDGRTVYLSSIDDLAIPIQARVVAVDAATGAVRWNHALLPGSFPSQIASLLATDRSVVVSSDGSRSTMIGLDARTGASRWQVTLPGTRLGTASLIDGQVWASVEHGRTLAIDPDRGRVTALFPGVGDDLGLVTLVQSPTRVGSNVIVAGGPALFGLAVPRGKGS